MIRGTDLKYPYVSNRKDALWYLRKGVGVESGFSIILLYFVEIYSQNSWIRLDAGKVYLAEKKQKVW